MFSDSELLQKLVALSKEERRITSEVLKLLREVLRRQLYAKRGHSSLFGFLVKDLGYDEASAYRRVSALRVIEAVPEVEKSLEEGKLSIATVAQAQTLFQQEKKRAKPYSVEKKRELLKRLEGASKREAEKILAQESPELARRDQTRVISETQTEIRFTADPALLEMLKQIQALAAHRKIEPGYNGLLKFMATEVLDRLDPNRQPPRQKRSLSPVKVPVKLQAPVKANVPRSRYIPQPVKREIWRRDQGRCAYVSPEGDRCESTHALQLDHIQPYAMGGPSTAENLRLLCATHNRLAAAEAFGLDIAARYIRECGPPA